MSKNLKPNKIDKNVNRGYTINAGGNVDSSAAFTKMIMGRLRDVGLSPPVFRTLSMSEFLNSFKDNCLDVFPDYQRGVVSDLAWAKELVEVMVYSAAPLNPIYLQCIDRDLTRFEVVDGAQRLTAFLLFMMGAFSIKDAAGEKDVWFENQNEPGHGFWAVCEGRTNGGVADYLDDSPISSTMVKFYEQTFNMVEQQTSTFERLENYARDNFIGRHLSVTVMPSSWSSELSILYTVYTNLKMWKQTKDECLVHLHDRASRQLKSMEKELSSVVVGCKIKFDSPTRQKYGVLVRLFACLSNFGYVPSEMDEKNYTDIMLEMVNRYSESDPDPDVMQRMRSGFRFLVEENENFGKLLSGKKLMSDQLVAILFVASSPGTNVCGMKGLLTFLNSAKNKYEDVLKGWRFRPAGETAKEFSKFWTQSSDRNLVRLCGMCLRLSSHCVEREEDNHAPKQRRIDGVN